VKYLTSAITVISLPLMILNMFGGIVSGIWLICLGEWSVIGLGIASLFASTFLLGLAMTPAMLLTVLAAKCAEKNRGWGLILFGSLTALYQYILIAVWCLMVFFLIANNATDRTVIPRMIWAYGMAIGPWAYMASREQGVAATIIVFFTAVSCLVTMLLAILTPVTRLTVMETFGCLMFVGFVVQSGIIILVQKELKATASAVIEAS
jgi:hypothetical protein